MTVEESKLLGATGVDRVQFLMEANQGQTRGTVDALASSGEKSRLLLLLEATLPPPPSALLSLGTGDVVSTDSANGVPAQTSGYGAIEDDIPMDEADDGDAGSGAAPCAVLYDEIDAHVGGRTAAAVGRLLANQGRESQVRWPIARGARPGG